MKARDSGDEMAGNRKKTEREAVVNCPEDESLKLKLGCCSGIHFLEGADGLKGTTDPRMDCMTRNVCCKGRRIRFRDSENCL